MAQAATDSVANTGSPPPDDKTPIDFLGNTDNHDLLGLQKHHVAEEQAAADDTMRALHADRDIAANYLSRQGVGPDDIPKWDADQERRKYETNPIESFGSLASVFAIAASAFTKAPMDNALNGAAAAMHAIRDKDDEGYKRAFDAWKANTDLTIKRHQMMHENYQDAITLMSTDMQLGEAKLKQMAARFGDQKTLMLMEHGYFPEMFQMIDARNKSIQGIIQTRQMTDEYTFRKQAADVAMQHARTPQEKLQAFNDAMGIKTDAEQQWNMQYWASHPATGDPKKDYDSWLTEYKKFKEASSPYRASMRPGSKAALVEALIPELQGEHPDWSPAQIAEEANRRAEAATTKPNFNQDTVKAKADEIQRANPGMSKADANIAATKAVKMASATPTGNRIDQIQQRVDQIDLADGVIGQVEDMLKKHNAITGLGGKITRPGEVLSDVFGSNASDRKQFESFINELQLLMPRILTDSQGRPLGAEASHINTIVRGLSVGDTTANTTRAMVELRKQLAKLKADAQTRMHGGEQAPTSAPAVAPAVAEPAWKRFSAPVEAP